MSLRHLLTTQIGRYEKEFSTLNRVEISRSAILHNLDVFHKLNKDFSFIPVLKSNAYGHGLAQVAEILKEQIVPYIAVDGYFEALEIHKISPQPILVMGYIRPENFPRMNLRGCAFVVYDESTIEALGKTGKKVKIHIELETGMNRLGVKKPQLAALLKSIKKYPTLKLEGVMTHLADADNPINNFTALQAKRFDEGVEEIRAQGFKPSLLHIAQSAGSVKVLSKYANTLRVGIGLYGFNPLPENDPFHNKLSNLKPALKVVSTLIKIENLEKNEYVGYGLTYTAKEPIRLGVIPFGYYEGLPRVLSNSGSLSRNKEFLPIVGRICMNHTMLDVSHSTATVGDEVTVISPVKTDPNSITSLCKSFNLFEYGILVGINQNIRRRVVD